MAIVHRTLPLQNARLRRLEFPGRYLKLNQAGMIGIAVAVVCLMSILYLAQTARVAAAGYRLQELEREHTELLREAEQYEFRIAQSSRLDRIAERATQLGLRPATQEQLRYATIVVPGVPVVADAKLSN